jgi:FkbM family methyltransferase
MRRFLRQLGLRHPQLKAYSGHLGLGRLLIGDAQCEQIVVDGDITLELDLSVPGFRYLYYHHDLSATPETFLWRRLLAGDDIFVDVGAHIGFFSLIAAKYAGRVFAFEPSPRSYSYLQRNLALNPRLASHVQSFPLGLSDRTGVMRLYSSESQPDLASLQPISVTDALEEEVSVDSLDVVLADEYISFLKIDVEGGEMAVLRGADKHIATDRPLVFLELFEPFQQRFGHSTTDIFDYFMNRNYGGLAVSESLAVQVLDGLVPLDVCALSREHVNNALFVPLEKLSNVQARVLSGR